MINQNELRNFIDKTIRINAFNLREYQDKYYFQKKIQEKIPEFSDKEIYLIIENLLTKGKKLNSKFFVNELSNELFLIYLSKGNDTYCR